LLTAAVNVMTYVVGDGKSNWLEGAILICWFCLFFFHLGFSAAANMSFDGAGFYINIAVSFWFYPGSTYSSTLGRCTADLR
jgi:Ca2+:H+ antiporter